MISKGMNNYRLSTYKHSDLETLEISPDLVSQVFEMEDIYIKGQNGLRVVASTGSLVKAQLFYILAKGSNGVNLIFKDSNLCGEYFNVTSQTINNRLNQNIPLSLDNLEYKLERKPPSLRSGVLFFPGSIVLMCILTSLLFLGGYLILDIVYLLSYLDFII